MFQLVAGCLLHPVFLGANRSRPLSPPQCANALVLNTIPTNRLTLRLRSSSLCYYTSRLRGTMTKTSATFAPQIIKAVGLLIARQISVSLLTEARMKTHLCRVRKGAGQVTCCKSSRKVRESSWSTRVLGLWILRKTGKFFRFGISDSLLCFGLLLQPSYKSHICFHIARGAKPT